MTVSLLGCRFFSVFTETEILLPTGIVLETGEASPSYWEIRWLEEDFRVNKIQVDRKSAIVLRHAKEAPLIVAARPSFPDRPAPWRSRPAGLVSPSWVTLESAPLEWKRGFAANFLLDLAEAGIPPDTVNISKFLNAADSRGGDSPWDLDRTKLTLEFLQGDIRFYSFSLRPSHTVKFALDHGNWYSEYLPADPLELAAGEWIGELTEGLHRFVHPLSQSVVSVMVDNRGDVLVLREK